MESVPGPHTHWMIFAKRFCNAKRFLYNGKRDLRGNFMGDTLGAMEALHRCSRTIINLLEEGLNVDGGLIASAGEGIEEADIYAHRLKTEIMAIHGRYEQEYGRPPPGIRDIVHLAMLRRDVHATMTIPTRDILLRCKDSLAELLAAVSEDVFGLPLALMDYHLVIKSEQLRNIMTRCIEDIVDEDYRGSVKNATLGFSIALEEQRQQLNYLLEREELSNALFFLDSPETLYYKLQDYSFILMALQVDPGKYRLFEKIVPTTMVSDETDTGVSITISDYVHERWIKPKWARFCFEFVCETVLMWQNMNLKEP